MTVCNLILKSINIAEMVSYSKAVVYSVIILTSFADAKAGEDG